MAVEPKYKDEGSFVYRTKTLPRCEDANGRAFLVQVVLRPVDPTSKPKFFDRYIFLAKDNPKMLVGRSTKRDTRLCEGVKNAWFDSAVMSRNHAKFVFLPANNVSSSPSHGPISFNN